jgi:hypothetical protein
VAHFRQAVDQGYRNARLAATDPDLEPLRARDDFQAVLKKLSEAAESARP